MSNEKPLELSLEDAEALLDAIYEYPEKGKYSEVIYTRSLSLRIEVIRAQLYKEHLNELFS